MADMFNFWTDSSAVRDHEWKFSLLLYLFELGFRLAHLHKKQLHKIENVRYNEVKKSTQASVMQDGKARWKARIRSIRTYLRKLIN